MSQPKFNKNDPFHMLLLDIVLYPAAKPSAYTYCCKIPWRMVLAAREQIIEGGIPIEVMNEHYGAGNASRRQGANNAR